MSYVGEKYGEINGKWMPYFKDYIVSVGAIDTTK